MHEYPNAPTDHRPSSSSHWVTVLRLVAPSQMTDPPAVSGDSPVSSLGTIGDEIKAVPIDRIEAGDDFATEVLVANRIIALFFHASNWYAIDGICSHQGGPLAGGHVRDGCVTCPWHGWQYDLATGIQTINRQPLQESFPVRRVDDRIEISINPNDESIS